MNFLTVKNILKISTVDRMVSTYFLNVRLYLNIAKWTKKVKKIQFEMSNGRKYFKISTVDFNLFL